MRSRMAGRSFVYCSPSLIVVTRLLAAMIASGEGVCADAAKVKQRKLPAMINKRLHMENPTEMRVPGNCRLLNSNLRPLDHGFSGVERGLTRLCHANKQVGHFRGAAQKPGYADHDQNAGGTDGKLLPETLGVLCQDPVRGKRQQDADTENGQRVLTAKDHRAQPY